MKLILRTSGCAASAAPAVAPRPHTTLSAPGGKPASSASSASRSAVSGVSSDGLSTTVQPAASAGATFHSAMASGKFHGTMAATTPTGSRRVYVTHCAPGMPMELSSVWPSSLVAQPAM
ncbi:hypothetical protein D3C72_1130550 [compost metagenome]